ncbi:winged helix-turn-helix domain-containing protein [Candidatus Gottesmanbacteria bacterium]|nr:winged helix-turn-helix domain-containing protein [Candidatus Gottesmanbacteria bacterium]
MRSLAVRFIEHDARATAAYLCFLAKSIQLEKYPKGNYMVLPRLIPKHPYCVHFPNYPYSSSFWQHIARWERYGVSGPCPQEAMTEMLFHLRGYHPPSAPLHITRRWKEKGQAFFTALSDVLNMLKIYDQVATIDILVTEFGTLGSFSATRGLGNTCYIACTVRVDGSGADLFRTLLQAFLLMRQGTGPSMDVGGIGWYEREAVLRHLLTSTKIRQLIAPLAPNTPDERLIQESHRYLASLGFPVNHDIAPAFARFLTNKERNVWEYLVANKQRIVSFDELADAVWKDESDEKFSLYALSKLIETIRRKLRAHSVNRQVIVTFRKRGYMAIA